MFKAVVASLVLCLFNYHSYSQNSGYPALENAILSIVRSDTSSSATIRLSPNVNFGISGHDLQYKFLVKNKRDLFLLLQGTHWVYKFDTASFQFYRLDTTFYRGSNFDCYFFSYNNTLYQYGGYGFWSNRDFLTYYVAKTRDWELIRSPRFIQNTYTARRMFWVDQVNGTLYVDGYV